MRTSEKGVFKFLGDPDRTDKEVHDALEEGRLIAFDAMSREQKNPAADEKSQTDFPARENRKDNSREDDGDSDGVEELVPAVRVLVIVLRHVLAE